MKDCGEVRFPDYTGVMVNMMPFLMGVPDTVPPALRGYLSLISRSSLMRGDTVYLTVHESLVEAGATQRRPGIHTDGTRDMGWGGGPWGGPEGIWMASTDGDCRAWDVETWGVDEHGSLDSPPSGEGMRMQPNRLYRLGDRTPHESLPAKTTHRRQFFRLVGPDIGGWWEQHSTRSPFGVQPQAPILTHSKFS